MERPRPGAAVWLTVVLCLLLRGLLELLPESYLVVADSVRIRDFSRVEASIRSRELRSPRMLLAGSSRVLFMSEAAHAAALGVEPEEVAHVSKIGNGWWDTLTLLRRNPELLENLELLVMDVYPAQARVSERFTENDLLFLSQAELRERWRVGDPRHRLQAFVDPLLPIWTHRLRVTEWQLLLRELLLGEPVLPPPVAELLRVRDVWQKVSGQERLALQVAYLFPDAPRSAVELGALRDLADLLPEGSRLLLLWLPFRDDFRALVAADEGMRRTEREFRALLEALDHPRIEVVWIDDQRELGLEAADYNVDGAHFKPRGNGKVMRRIAELERQLLRTP